MFYLTVTQQVSAFLHRMFPQDVQWVCWLLCTLAGMPAERTMVTTLESVPDI